MDQNYEAFVTAQSPADTCIETRPLKNAPSGAALFRALGGHYTSPAQAICELVDDSLSSIMAQSGPTKEVVLELQEGDTFVDITVSDSGTGIKDLSAALTISGSAAAQTPYNEHGCGLKSALSHLCAGKENWSIETRTAEDLAAGHYRRVSAPYEAVDRQMLEQTLRGEGHLLYATGTTIRLRCPRERFLRLRPANKREVTGFIKLVDYLEEELRYTYAPLLENRQLLLRILASPLKGGEDPRCLTALDPIWAEPPTELPKTEVDLGQGRVTIQCRYGLIEKARQNSFYYTCNMRSSGFEIRLNGRCIAHGLMRDVYGKAAHNSGNRFLAQVHLESMDGAALPPTENTKNAFVDGDPRTQALYTWLRSNVEPPRRTARKHGPEKRLVDRLAEKKRQEPGILRVAREVRTYQCIGLRNRIDLLVSGTEGVTIYEAKDEESSGGDLYQLRLYADGCAMDGVPVKESILIAARHSREVVALAEQLNHQQDPTGEPYHFTLRTWTEEGITA